MFLLGLADIASALLLIRGVYQWNIPSEIVTIFAAYLIIKAVIFIFDITSLIDLVAGALLLVSVSSNIPEFILYGFAIFVGFKGAMTLMAKA